MSGNVIFAWVPGLPHLLRPELSTHYKALNSAMGHLGSEFQNLGVKRILYYSTQWLSVLGQSVQTRTRLSGQHVDENWYDMASLKFDFSVDQAMAQGLIKSSEDAGLQTRGVDYEGFPVDTGTIVADKLINPRKLPVGMYSSCVYSDYAETQKIGSLARSVINTLDGTTAVVAVSGLSGRYFTTEIDYTEDHIRDPRDDAWNQKILALMARGDWAAMNQIRGEYCASCKVDMGLKALAFLEGVGLTHASHKLKTLAYGAIYGTGAGVMISDH
jgi:2-aminophenol/2-amino-5-chlorophenol 1,6-dioxygenase alpha subunit